MAAVLQLTFWKMEFPDRLAQLRKVRNLTQQQLADKAGVHVVQIRRYEGGVSQPAVDVLKRLAIALSVSADALLFDEAERGPNDELRLQFEALAAMSAAERQVAKTVLDAMIVRNQVAGTLERHSEARVTTPPTAKAKRSKPRARA